jgi:predicted lipoprotein with Yx(FWY)xxD motif
MHRRLLSLLLVFIVAACATPAQPPAMGTAGFMVTTNGMSLYTYDRDEVGSGRSACLGQCAVTFPPYMAPSGAKPEGDFTLIPRDGGGMQWAYKGKPLYRFVGDGRPGDINGRGLNGVWQLARQ